MAIKLAVPPGAVPHEVAHEVANEVVQIKDKIWDLGVELCKDRPNNKLCAKFGGGGKNKTNTTEAPTTGAPNTTPSTTPHTTPDTTPNTALDTTSTTTPNTSPGTTPNTTPDTTSSTTANIATPAPAAGEAGAIVAPAPEDISGGAGPLPSQGFSGPKVEHKDGKTAVNDWQNEYGNKATSQLDEAHHSGSPCTRGCFVVTLLAILLAVVSAGYKR